MTRRCKTCGEEKPLNKYNFQAQEKNGVVYYRTQCLDCYNAIRRKRYEVDSVYHHKCNARVARWLERNPEYMRDYWRTYKRKAKQDDARL